MKPGTMLAKLELVRGQKDAKCSFPLGPYPRYTWIHEDTPEDGLDKACYQIWKRVQQLSAQLERSPKEADSAELSQAKVGFEGEEGPGDPAQNKAEGKAADSCGRDDVSLLVQLEYLSILGENVSMDLSQSGLEGTGPMEQGLKKQEAIRCPVSEVHEKENLLDGFLKPCSGAQSNDSSLAEDKTKPEKQSLKDAMPPEPSTEVSVASNREICQLLAQFSLKQISEREAPDNSVVMEEAQIIKHFLQNNMFSSAGERRAEVSSPLPPSARGEQGAQSRRQLPVFAKLCEEPPPPSGPESHPPLRAAGGAGRPEEPPGAPVDLAPAPEAAGPGTDLLRLLCPSAAGSRDSPKVASPDLKPKSQSGPSSKSEHSYSTTRHSLKGLAAATRLAGQDFRGLAKPREAPNRQSGPKHKEELPNNKGGSEVRETTQKRAAHTLGDAEDKVPGSRRESAAQKPDAQDGDSLGAHSSSDSAGSGNKEEGHAGGSGPPKVGGGKDGEGRYGGKAFPSQAKSSPSGAEGPALGHADKSAAASGLQQVGPLAYPARYPGGPVTVPNRPALINYPPVPPAATSTLGYTQHQPFYQSRSLRLPQHQPAYHQAGCLLRPNNAYSYSQLAHDFLSRQACIRAAYPPLVGYWSFVPEYSYPTRNNPKPMASVGGGNNPPPMAGDGPQCLFQPAYGYLDSNVSAARFTDGRTGALYNNGTFHMYYTADRSGYSYW